MPDERMSYSEVLRRAAADLDRLSTIHRDEQDRAPILLDAAALRALAAQMQQIERLMNDDHDLDAEEFAHQYNGLLRQLAAGFIAPTPEQPHAAVPKEPRAC